MTWLSRICFSAAVLSGFALQGATVAGAVRLRDSRSPAVRKKADFSGVVVQLRAAGEAQPAAPRRAVMDQRNKTFIPHVLAIPVGSSVEFPNNDPIFHNAFSNYNGQIFDVGLYPPGSKRTVRFKRAGIVRVFCNIHSNMSAIIAVVDTPWFAVTGNDGRFTIADVPDGEYEVQYFHERSTAATLASLTRKVVVRGDTVLPPAEISESGFLPIPHKNKYGHEYPPPPDAGAIYPAVR